MTDAQTRLLVALGAIAAPALHSFTDLLELAAGFSPMQLWLNYLAFLALPFVLIGLHAVQRPKADALSLAGALAYGGSFIYFAGSSTYAIARAVPDYDTLLDELGTMYIAHGALMIIGGIMFGVAVTRTRVLPAWTGRALVLGVVVNLLVALGAATPLWHSAGTLIRNVALIGMGLSLLPRPGTSDARMG